MTVQFECEPRPNCPLCGVPWSDEMVALFDIALGLGCSCCTPLAENLPDIVCHACKKVLYTTRAEGLPADSRTAQSLPELDLTPDP